MTEKQKLVYVKGMIVAAEIELAAMKAENVAREIAGQAPAYGEKQFMDLISNYSLHHNGLMESLRNYD